MKPQNIVVSLFKVKNITHFVNHNMIMITYLAVPWQKNKQTEKKLKKKEKKGKKKNIMVICGKKGKTLFFDGKFQKYHN